MKDNFSAHYDSVDDIRDHQAQQDNLSILNKSRPGASFDSTDRQGLFNFLSFATSALSLLMSLILVGLYMNLANKPLPSLVQTSDGKTMRILAQNSDQRSPEVLKNTVIIALTKLLTWRSFSIPTNAKEMLSPKPDIGIEIPPKGLGTGGKVPTSVYEASFYLTSDFQEPFISNLASLVKEAGVFTANAQVSFEILSISDNPISLGQGLWRVDIVGNLVRLLPNKTITRLKFNKQVFLKAVPPSPILDQANTPEALLSKLVAEGSATGVKIYAIRDLDVTNINLYPNTPSPAATLPSTQAFPSPNSSR
jgi:hypothetical protein